MTNKDKGTKNKEEPTKLPSKQWILLNANCSLEPTCQVLCLYFATF